MQKFRVKNILVVMLDLYCSSHEQTHCSGLYFQTSDVFCASEAAYASDGTCLYVPKSDILVHLHYLIDVFSSFS